MSRSALVLVTAVALAVVVIAACDDGPVAQPCSSIPAGGCPLGRGVSCSDPACEAVYACRPNDVWELDHRCPARDAEAPPAVIDAGADADPSSSPPFDAAVDAPPGAYGGPGCASLQTPDCSLGLALSCGAGCCGCEDLFVCSGGGWELWGTCGDAGPVQSR